MDENIRHKLLELGWNENTRYPNTNRWHFFEIRNFNVLRVICIIEEGAASLGEVRDLKDYLKRRMPWFTFKQMGLAIVFSKTPQFVDLSEFISKYAETPITVQKIIQFTPERVYEQNTWLIVYMDQYLGGFVPEIAGPREVVTSSIDGGFLESAWKKNWLLYAIIIMVLCSILQFLLK